MEKEIPISSGQVVIGDEQRAVECSSISLVLIVKSFDTNFVHIVNQIKISFNSLVSSSNLKLRCTGLGSTGAKN